MTCSTEEKYLIAIDTNNLKVEADVHGAGDVLIASGWSDSRIGGALLRLHTKATRGGLYKVHYQVTLKAESMGVDRPDAVASAVIRWWLDRLCKTCFGRKFDAIPGTPSLSAIECPKCHGTGVTPIPFGDVGQNMVAWLDKCKHAHVGIIKRRLRDDD